MNTNSTSVFPEEIFPMILKNMILEKSQLLNARLVSRFWNKEALVQLKKSNFKITMDHRKIKYYVKFTRACASPTPQFILPFVLKFHIPAIQTEETEISLELERIHSSLESLLNIFKPECIHTLDFCVSPKTVEQLYTVIKILIMSSPDVDTITFSLNSLGENINVETLNTLFKTRELSFPKLKQLDLSSLHLSRPESHRRLAQLLFCSHLIKASPTLEILTLPSSLKINEMEISPELLKQIKFLSVKDFLLVDLVGNDLLAPTRLPSLTKLQIRASWPSDRSDYNRFVGCLIQISHSLEYLDIEFIGGRPSKNLLIFPEFQSLKQLRIRSYWNVIPDFVNPVIFPVMTSIDMHLEIFGVLRKTNECDDGITLGHQMPNVKQVTIRLRSQVGHVRENILNLLPLQLPVTNPHPFHTYFDYLTDRFPNARKLIIVNESYDEKSFKPFFRGLKGSEGAKNFHELEFEDFDENYLGQIFEETLYTPKIILKNMPRNPDLEKAMSEVFRNLATGLDVPVVIKIRENGRTTIQAHLNQDVPNQLINLKSLTFRLSLSAKSKCLEERVKRLTALRCTAEERNKLLEGIPNPLNLLSLALNLPSLEEIRISPLMFGYDKIIQAQEIQSVHEEYPGMKIITI